MSDQSLATPRRPVLDVAVLPEYAFGHNGLIWWGTVGFMVIEGSVFVMVLVAYYFLRMRVAEWPPSLPNPDLTFGTINTAILLASLVPNQMAKKAAEQLDVRKVRILLPVCLVFGVAFVAVRALEFGSLNCTWDDNAYASIVWFIMGVHTLHLVTDVADSFVLTGLVFTAYIDPTRMVDVSENALYWYFVVLIWIPIYLTIYFAPRVL
jgi:heme/copper-type cytochrome/quinol oxidase subunit 3